MRYIKTFESDNWWVDKTELKSFAESYLAYLMDEGFVIGINLDRHEDDAAVDLHLTNPDGTIYENDIPFLWKDIKDHFIMFKILKYIYFMYFLNNSNVIKAVACKGIARISA